MQFEFNVETYNSKVESKKVKSGINLKSEALKISLVVVVGLMLSRVQFELTDGLILAPFGVAYLLTILLKRDVKSFLVGAAAVGVGYMSVLGIHTSLITYATVLFSLSIYGYIVLYLDRNVNKKMMFGLAIGIFIFVDSFLGTNSLGGNILFSTMKAIAILPMFYIINYGVNCLWDIKTNYLFSTEELISIAIVLCLVVAGVGNVELITVNFRMIIALGMVITVAYAGGSTAGAIMGITMGFIVGIANNDVLLLTSLYSICGLIVGMFKEIGKVFAILAYFLAYYIVISKGGNLTLANLIEAGAPALIMLAIPANVVKAILVEINNQEKAKVINDMQVQGVKSEIVERLNDMRSVLSSVSTSMKNLSENDKLLMKGKGTALVESLADRVCATCECNKKCWERELNSTFVAFGDLIGSCQQGKIVLPRELDKKCIKTFTLMRNTESLINNYAVNENLKKRLIEGRKLIANQINNMSFTVGKIISDFNRDVADCLEIDKLLRKTLSRNRIDYNELYTYTDRRGRLKIKIKMNQCNGGNYCVKNILPAISNLVKMPVNITDEGCRIDPNTNECYVVIEETPKYHISSYVSSMPKEGEEYSGDSFNFGKDKNGVYVTAVSDGMGSGPEAGVESGIAIDLVENFMEAGFGESATLNTINAIMGMKFNEDEKFTTLDMNSIDLYTGDVSFIKVGGVASFIKRDKKVDVIESKGLPFGILDEIDLEPIQKKITHGDIIVTISDGILDVDKTRIGDATWLKHFISNGSTNPEVLCNGILEKAKELSGGRILDDMTVVVSKVYSVY